ncbi:hypothetical protein SSP531S_21280 [Streptomyces spongiicola]|uniref:Uncharacterized protein n=1 Tax=Streptomyces spongiicola TaxID=1690221 RepID=A0A388SVW4_9ACTN|nr:hypothetical protein SSP531S_21280 [Streptomyces spongiicola]
MLIYQHSDPERQQEVAGGLDKSVRAARQEGRDQPSGADPVRDAQRGPDNDKAPGRWPGASVWSG